MAEEAKKKEAPKKEIGFVEVEYLKDIGTHTKGEKDVMHRSTAESLAKKGKEFVKILKDVVDYKPKKAKD